MRTRRLTAGLALLLVAGILLLDRAVSAPPDPFRAPPVVALGSGAAPAGAHCAAPLR